jgi:hypothetical protein
MTLFEKGKAAYKKKEEGKEDNMTGETRLGLPRL